MRKKCIAVRSVTYAQKALETLKKHGIKCEMRRAPAQIRVGCGWCVSVSETQLGTVKSLLQKNGIKITGETYDLP